MKRKILVLSIFLILLTAFSAVSAAEDMDNQTVSTDSDLANPAIEDDLGETQEVVRNFTEIQTRIDEAEENDTIELEGTYQSNGNPIQVSKSVTLQGKGEGATLDGANLSSIITVSANNVILKNINFINGYNQNSGGAIYWCGDGGQIINSTFISNNAQYGSGVYFSDSNNVTLAQSKFSKDKVYMGVVYISDCSNMTLSDNIFSEIDADYNSGVFFYNSSNTLIENNEFNNLSSQLYICAIEARYNQNPEELANSKIVGCTFSRDHAISVPDTVEVIKKNAEILCDDIIFDFHNGGVYTIHVRDQETKKGLKGLTIEIEGTGDSNFTWQYETDENGDVIVDLNMNDFNAGSWNLTVRIQSDMYVGENNSAKLIVNRLMPSISMENYERIVGGSFQAEAYIDCGDYPIGNEKVKIYLDDEYVCDMTVYSNRVVTNPIYVSEIGNHTLKVVYGGNDNVLPANGTSIVSVIKIDTTVYIYSVDSGHYGDEINGSVTLRPIWSTVNDGTVTFYINGVEGGRANVSDNKANFTYFPPHAGYFNLTMQFSGSVNFTDCSVDTGFYVSSSYAQLFAENASFNKNDDKLVHVTVKDKNGRLVEGENVEINIVGRSFCAVTDSQGIAAVNMTELAPGEYVYSANTYNSTRFYYSSSNYYTIVVRIPTRVEIADIGELVYGDVADFNVTVIAESGTVNEGIVNLYINGSETDFEAVVNNAVRFQHLLDVGIYSVVVAFDNSTHFEDSSCTVQVVVNRMPTSLAVEDLIFAKDDVKVIPFNLTDKYGVLLSKDVIFNITDVDGNEVSDLACGVYSFNVIFEGDENYIGCKSETKRIIVRTPTQMAIDTVLELTYGEGSVFAISVIPEVFTVNEGIVKLYINGALINSSIVVNNTVEFRCLFDAGFYNVTAVFGDSLYFEDSNATVQVVVNRMPTSLAVEDLIFAKDDVKVISFNLTDKNGVLLSKDVIFNITDAGGNAVSDLACGEYSFNVIFEGDANYLPSKSETKRIIVRTPTQMAIDTVLELTYGNLSVFSISVIPEVFTVNEGIVKLYINGALINSSNVANNTVEFGCLFDAGFYNVTAVFDDSLHFEDSNATVQVVVNRMPTSLAVEDLIFARDDVKVIPFNLTDINGVVLSKEVKINVTNLNGESVVNLTCGEYRFDVVFEGDENYLGCKSETKRIIVRTPTQITINALRELTYGDLSVFSISVIPEVGTVNEGVVRIYINGAEINYSNVVNNTVEFRYLFDAGFYNVNASFGGSLYFVDSNDTIQVVVNRMQTVLTTEDHVFEKTDEKVFRFNLTDINGVKLSKDVKINITNMSGAVADINNLESGKYLFNVIFEGDENYVESKSETRTLIVRMPTSIRIANISNPLTLHSIELNATLLDENGNVIDGDLHYYINGNEISGNFTPSKTGKHNLTVTYAGDRNNSPSSAAVTFDVGDGRQETAIASANVVMTYGDSKYIKATLKTSDGKALNSAKVKITLNGKTEELSTDSNGEVKLAVNVIPKTYDAKIAFAGDTYYKPVSKTVKVTVNKATVKLTAKAKTFKAKVKTKKYKITLKSNKNKAISKAKVTLKVKGKTYKAKTNAKGVATFKITKLAKKGTHKATIKFSGDKCYKGISKKVKIKVK